MCIDKMRYIMIGCALALIALAGCKTPELSMDERSRFRNPARWE